MSNLRNAVLAIMVNALNDVIDLVEDTNPLSTDAVRKDFNADSNEAPMQSSELDQIDEDFDEVLDDYDDEDDEEDFYEDEEDEDEEEEVEAKRPWPNVTQPSQLKRTWPLTTPTAPVTPPSVFRDGDIVVGRVNGSGPYVWGGTEITTRWKNALEDRLWRLATIAERANFLAVKKIAPHKVVRETVSRDLRGRACCPVSITQAIGLLPGNFAYLAKRAGGAGAVIMKKAALTGHLTTYRVDNHGNLRLTRGLLRKAGLGNASSVKFRTTDDGMSIVVVKG